MDICAIRELRTEDALYWLKNPSLGLGRAENAILQNPTVGDRTLIGASFQIMSDSLEDAMLLGGSDQVDTKDYTGVAADPKEQYLFHREVASLMRRLMSEVYQFTEKWNGDRLDVPKQQRVTSNLETRIEKQSVRKNQTSEQKKPTLIAFVNKTKKEKVARTDDESIKKSNGKHYADKKMSAAREQKILDYQENCQLDDYVHGAWSAWGVDPEEDAQHWQQFVPSFLAKQRRALAWISTTPLEETAKIDRRSGATTKLTFSKPPTIKACRSQPLQEADVTGRMLKTSLQGKAKTSQTQKAAKSKKKAWR